jgi:hypothetical protein
MPRTRAHALLWRFGNAFYPIPRKAWKLPPFKASSRACLLALAYAIRINDKNPRTRAHALA